MPNLGEKEGGGGWGRVGEEEGREVEEGVGVDSSW